MACTITQATLGPAFADVDPDIAALWIEVATVVVLGPDAQQALVQAKWLACGVDPCMAIRLLASHQLATLDPSADAKTVTSESVADVSTSYATAGSSAGIWTGSQYGVLYATLLDKFEVCTARRSSFPRATTGRGCGC